MKHSSLGLALVGCGYFGKKRLEALVGLQDRYHLRHVVDTNPQNLEHAKRIFPDIHCHDRVDDVLTDSRIQVCIVAVPNAFHYPIAKKIIRAGRHVLIEKPLATSLRQVNGLMKAAADHRVIVKVGSNHRFFPHIEYAIDQFRSGHIGRLLMIRGSIGTNGNHTKNSWFWNKRISGGGTFIDNACHLIDIAQALMGPFAKCTGHTSTVFWKKSEVEDQASGTFVTPDGRQVVISASWTQWAGYIRLELWGDSGYIIVDTTNETYVKIGDKDGTSPLVRLFPPTNTSYASELRYFHDCIIKNNQPTPGLEEGKRVIQMIDNFYKASDSGTWIRFRQI